MSNRIQKINRRVSAKYLQKSLVYFESKLLLKEKIEFRTFIDSQQECPFVFKAKTIEDIWTIIVESSRTGTFFDVVLVQCLVFKTINSMYGVFRSTDFEKYLPRIWQAYVESHPTIFYLNETYDVNSTFTQFLVDELSFERHLKEWADANKEMFENLKNGDLCV
ncbi:hypothetical protein K2P97_10085 [bacterium]|nr:hypothetical protein [bacterium]